MRTGSITAVSIGRPRTVGVQLGQCVATAIFEKPVSARVKVGEVPFIVPR